MLNDPSARIAALPSSEARIFMTVLLLLRSIQIATARTRHEQKNLLDLLGKLEWSGSLIIKECVPNGLQIVGFDFETPRVKRAAACAN